MSNTKRIVMGCCICMLLMLNIIYIPSTSRLGLAHTSLTDSSLFSESLASTVRGNTSTRPAVAVGTRPVHRHDT
jgi:hypothetical protein